MTALPPRMRLVRAATSLARHLPGELAALLDAPRFADERPALARLADADHARAAAAAMSEAEASWLADLLVERWAAVAAVTLDPVAAIVAPAEVWLGRAPVAVTARVAVDGVDEGWRARWDGPDVAARADAEPADACTVTLRRADGEQPPPDLALRVAVEGRAAGARVLLVDHARVAVRVPALAVSDDRRQVLVRDHRERPAADTRVLIGDAERRTDAHGVVHLDQPAPAGAEVRVDGALAGRVPSR